MTSSYSRRRFLSISATYCLTAMPAGAEQSVHWQGQALGAKASMVLSGLTAAKAQSVMLAVEQELSRLEQIFSLYKKDSEISQLNSFGQLAAPSPDLLNVLSLSASLHKATFGAFDPSIQPIWQAMKADGDQTKAQLAVGWHHVHFDAQKVHFARSNMALTLNGVAQGYLTDKITALLRGWGLTNILIDIGEIAALGTKPNGQDWQAGISRADGTIVQHVALRDRALATSAPYATRLAATGKNEHIIDPRSNTDRPKQCLVSVSAPLAAVADGLSTGCCLLTHEKARQAVAAFSGAKLEFII